MIGMTELPCPPGYEDTGVGINRILICLQCGSTVSFCLTTVGYAPDIHDKWHRSIDETAVLANRLRLIG